MLPYPSPPYAMMVWTVRNRSLEIPACRVGVERGIGAGVGQLIFAVIAAQVMADLVGQGVADVNGTDGIHRKRITRLAAGV